MPENSEPNPPEEPNGNGGNNGSNRDNNDNNEGGGNHESFLEKLASWFPFLPQIILGVIGVIAIISIIAIVGGGNLSTIGNDGTNVARGLITFLVAMVTVAIALILTLSAVLSNSTDYKERFALGKEVLTIFIGVLGTIIGFYFGSVKGEPPPAPNNNVSANTNRSDNSNSSSNSNSNSTSNTNSEETARRLSAIEAEKKGFNAIIAQDFDAAAASFQAAYSQWNNYHNVDEINRLLQKNKAQFAQTDPVLRNTAWREVYCEIAKNYEWGMPEDLLVQFEAKLKSQNYICTKSAE